MESKIQGFLKSLHEAKGDSKGGFHLSELPGQILAVVMRISFLIKTIQPGDGFSAKPLETADFIVKLTGLAMVRMASSDKWKAP